MPEKHIVMKNCGIVNPDDLADQSWYTVTLTAQTRKPDPEYTQNGGYRQRVLQSRVALRNL